VYSLCATGAAAQSVRVTQSIVGVIGVGQTATMTWTITGTTRPVRLRLTNTHPETATLEGGNIQTVTSSGGAKNLVSRKVTGLTQGQFNVEVEVAGIRDDPEVVANAFRRELRRIAAETKAEAKRLPVQRDGGQRTIATTDMLALIDRAQQDVVKSLPFDDLAALRDAVSAFLAELRRDVEKMTVARRRASAILLVQDRPASAPPRLREKDARSTITRLIDFLSDLSGEPPLRTICVVSMPESGAVVAVYPASFPNGGDKVTSTAPMTLYIGQYLYEVTRNGYPAFKGTLDLLTKPGDMLECSLSTTCDLKKKSRDKCQ
jgi:hypothetical protein